jgi:serine/threonine protein phosphatase PrpC
MIRTILLEPNTTLEAACARLIEAALAGGGPDNVTVVTVASGTPKN